MADEDPTLSKVLGEDLRTEKRQELISYIEDELENVREQEDVRVMTYLGHESMTAFDVKAFEDMLQSVEAPKNLYLFINSPGGDPETALRIIHMCRERSETFRTIVPDMAKSAATQVCLGSGQICMGYNSELGPIDPQIQFRGEWTAAYTIKEGLEYIENRAESNPDVPVQIYQAIAQHYDPALIKRADKAIEYIRDSATDIAGNMFDDDEKANECVEKLLDLEPHAKSITADDATDMGLDIFDLRENGHIWSAVWELYIRSDTIMSQEERGKLWETKEHVISSDRSEESSDASNLSGFS